MTNNIRPSNYERRLLCPGSYNAEKDLPNVPSKYAQEGTLLHERTTLYLKGDDKWSDNLNEVQQTAVLKSGKYFNALKSKEHCILRLESHEKSYDLSFIYPELTGTPDSVLLLKNMETNKNELHIIDYKFGKGVPVSAYRNYQLLLYCLGVAEEPTIKDMLKESVPEINLHIVQPFIRNSHWQLIEEELFDFGSATPYKNAIEACLQPDAPRIPSVKACKFCKAKSTCKELAKTVPNIKLKPGGLSDNKLKKIYDDKKLILMYLNSIDDCIMGKLEQGSFFDYVLEPKLTNFKWVEGAEERLVELIGEAAYEKKLISITKAKQLVEFDVIDELTIRSENGNKIVKLENKSKEIFKNFDNN